MDSTPADSSLILYQTEDGQTRIEVRLLDETVWLTQAQMSELFDKDKRTISEHIHNIFKEGELQACSTIRKFRIVQFEGSRKIVAHRGHGCCKRKLRTVERCAICFQNPLDLSMGRCR